MLRETESNLQAWNSKPKSSESRTWPNEDVEQSIDLRVDGISNDETYEDEQYMQRIAEQVQKLIVAKEILKDNSSEDNILREKTVKKIHDAGNSELHAIQQRTDKVQYNVNVAIHTLKPDFKCVHAEENWNERSQAWCSAMA